MRTAFREAVGYLIYEGPHVCQVCRLQVGTSSDIVDIIYGMSEEYFIKLLLLLRLKVAELIGDARQQMVI